MGPYSIGVRVYGLRIGALAVIGVLTLFGAGCGGGHALPILPPAGPLPAPSDATPQGAVAGFMTGLAKGPSGACLYVEPEDLIDCGEAFTTTIGFSATDLGVGKVTIQGTEALVSVTGRICTTINGKTTCAVNSDPSAGQPSSGATKAFAAAFAEGGTLGKRAIPCAEVDGLWYVDLPI